MVESAAQTCATISFTVGVPRYDGTAMAVLSLMTPPGIGFTDEIPGGN